MEFQAVFLSLGNKYAFNNHVGSILRMCAQNNESMTTTKSAAASYQGPASATPTMAQFSNGKGEPVSGFLTTAWLPARFTQQQWGIALVGSFQMHGMCSDLEAVRSVVSTHEVWTDGTLQKMGDWHPMAWRLCCHAMGCGSIVVELQHSSQACMAGQLWISVHATVLQF